MLHAAKDLFGNMPKQHSFADKLYDFEKIDYIKPANIKNFNERLLKLPKSERVHFSVNLSHRQTVIYLLHVLDKNFADQNAKVKFKKVVTAYVASRPNVEMLFNVQGDMEYY